MPSKCYTTNDSICNACCKKEQRGRGDNVSRVGNNAIVTTLRPKQKFDLLYALNELEDKIVETLQQDLDRLKGLKSYLTVEVKQND